MKDLLITGGLGQAGMAMAEAALAAGWSLTLVGRSPLKQKPARIQQWVKDRQLEYVSLDIFALASRPSLLTHAIGHRHWIQSAEPYQRADLRDGALQAKARFVLEVALEAGYSVGSGRIFARIGSPLVEVMQTRARYPIMDGLYIEDMPLSSSHRKHPAFATAYFRAKAVFAAEARSYFANRGLSVIHLCPTALVGPFGDKSADYDGFRHALQRDFPYNLYLPTNVVNAVPVRIFAKAALRALEAGVPGNCYQFAGVDLPTSELFGMALRAAHLPLPRLRWPAPPGIVGLPMVALMAFPFRLFPGKKPWWLDTDLHAMLAMMGRRSAAKVSAEFGYPPVTMDDLRQAVEEAVAWELGHGS